MELTVSMSNPIDVTTKVNVRYTDLTATGSSGGTGADYDNGTDQVTFNALSTTPQTVTVAITDDNIVEALEKFRASLALDSTTPLTGYSTATTDTADGTITDNDTATFTIDDVTVNEGSGTMTLTVSLFNPIDVRRKVKVSSTDLTARGWSGGTGADEADGR